MNILVIGLNHTTAPLDLRERLALTEDNIRALFANPRRGSDCPVSEALILSTCNRTELYAVSSDAGFDGLENYLAEATHVPADLFQPHLYRLMTERPLPRAALPPGIEDRAALPLHEALGGDADLARAAWAFAHGMTNLELNGRFPENADLDAAWDRGLAAFRGAGR